MGLYRYITEEETKRMKRIDSDNDLNELFQTALGFRPELLIEEDYYYKKSKWWIFNGKKEKKFRYTLYAESRAADGSAYQARYITDVPGDRRSITTYLFGIVDLGHYLKNKEDASN